MKPRQPDSLKRKRDETDLAYETSEKCTSGTDDSQFLPEVMLDDLFEKESEFIKKNVNLEIFEDIGITETSTTKIMEEILKSTGREHAEHVINQISQQKNIEPPSTRHLPTMEVKEEDQIYKLKFKKPNSKLLNAMSNSIPITAKNNKNEYAPGVEISGLLSNIMKRSSTNQFTGLVCSVNPLDPKACDLRLQNFNLFKSHTFWENREKFFKEEMQKGGNNSYNNKKFTFDSIKKINTSNNLHNFISVSTGFTNFILDIPKEKEKKKEIPLQFPASSLIDYNSLSEFLSDFKKLQHHFSFEINADEKKCILKAQRPSGQLYWEKLKTNLLEFYRKLKEKYKTNTVLSATTSNSNISKNPNPFTFIPQPQNENIFSENVPTQNKNSDDDIHWEEYLNSSVLPSL